MRSLPSYVGPHVGKFSIGAEKEFFGQLTIDGPKSLLYLRDERFVPTHNIPHGYISGILNDLKRVSLHRCFIKSDCGSFTNAHEGYSYAELVPQLILVGDHHLAPHDQAVSGIDFQVDDIAALFYDPDLFGRLLEGSEQLLPDILASQSRIIGRKITAGEEPQVYYFTGRRKIFSAETSFGTVSASNNPSYSRSQGLRVTNSIYVSIDFLAPRTLNSAVQHIGVVAEFLSVVVGRPQDVTKTSVRTTAGETHPLDLYSHSPMHDRAPSLNDQLQPQGFDNLIHATRDSNSFSKVLTNWIEREDSWGEARRRFYYCFKKEHSYDHDRLIGAANCYDLLPPSAWPQDTPLAPELASAKELARKMFRQLPQSAERESALNDLGRIGKSKLKQKARHRAQIVLRAEPDRFSELTLVMDQAVNCRNYYVHGGETKINYSAHFGIRVFLTDALEYVFATSDLIEAGWDVIKWRGHAGSLTHRFAAFRFSYDENLDKLKKLLASSNGKL